MKTTLVDVIFAAGAVLVFNAVAITAAAGATNFCRLTSERMLQSCLAEAHGDSWLASAKCSNISDAAERAACRQQVQPDHKDARQTCHEQKDARNAVCNRLGGARYDPVIDPANFVSAVNHTLFPLVPGTTFIYEGQTAAGLEHTEFSVTNNTKVILGVTCVEVHDIAKLDGELIEDTLDWFCQDQAGNVWYFGENTKELEGGLVISLEGSWTAGVDGAKPGIIMKAQPAIGDFYRQEFSLGNAEDLAEVIGLNESVTVPFGSFNNCLKTLETTPMEPDLQEHKFYCLGVGLVLTIDLTTGEKSELIAITP
ncbi:MAG TPA: hypothetical protein VGL70_22345 [Candidatus Binatia bacterium]|jgi:hypothetical protein